MHLGKSQCNSITSLSKLIIMTVLLRVLPTKHNFYDSLPLIKELLALRQISDFLLWNNNHDFYCSQTSTYYAKHKAQMNPHSSI